MGNKLIRKVYMIEKKDTKALYAMKCIRKELLIKADQIESTKLEKFVMKAVNNLVDFPPIYHLVRLHVSIH
jgi:hypothetical protein